MIYFSPISVQNISYNSQKIGQLHDQNTFPKPYQTIAFFLKDQLCIIFLLKLFSDYNQHFWVSVSSLWNLLSVPFGGHGTVVWNDMAHNVFYDYIVLHTSCTILRLKCQYSGQILIVFTVYLRASSEMTWGLLCLNVFTIISLIWFTCLRRSVLVSFIK